MREKGFNRSEQLTFFRKIVTVTKVTNLQNINSTFYLYLFLGGKHKGLHATPRYK